jgi:release factor glutamine methyltransferase
VGIRKTILNTLAPILRRLAMRYLSKVRMYSYQNIRIKVNPGIFHPGLFLSTNVLLKFLKKEHLESQKILELGAGSGLIAIYCSLRGADVTASDISNAAIMNIKENAVINSATFDVVKSDLFSLLDPKKFDLIVINPPYYPKEVTTEKDLPWFCGKDFEYFKALFKQISDHQPMKAKSIMILSEDCDLSNITRIAEENRLSLVEIHRERKMGEFNFIYEIIAC